MPRITLRFPPSVRPLLERLRAAARASGQRLWLAGGFLRDRVLDIPPKPELDFTLADPKALLASLALRRGESAFVLDAERDTIRIVLPPPGPIGHIDLTRLRAPTIEADLRLRDFTANAIALEVTADDPAPPLIDPTGGAGDLARGILRACSSRSFADDPLRVLRGVRIATARGLQIEPATRERLMAASGKLRRVSRERVRDELFQMLQGGQPATAVEALARLGLLRAIGLPGVPVNGSFPALRRVEGICRSLPRRGAMRRALGEPIEQGVTRGGILSFSALLLDHDGGRRGAAISAALMLGARATKRCVETIAAAVPRGWYRPGAPLAREEWLDFFRATDGAAREAILLHAPSAAAAQRLFGRYAAVRRRFLRPPLLSGDAAMRQLGLPPGPQLGRLLAAAKRAQDLGRISDSAAAVRWARHATPHFFGEKTPPQRTP